MRTAGGNWNQKGSTTNIAAISVSPQNAAKGIAVGKDGKILVTGNSFTGTLTSGAVSSLALYGDFGSYPPRLIRKNPFF
jgi:hypothetical protein